MELLFVYILFLFFVILFLFIYFFFFFSSRRRHTRWTGDRSSDVCSSDLEWRPRARPPRREELGDVLDAGAKRAPAVVAQQVAVVLQHRPAPGAVHDDGLVRSPLPERRE